MLRPANNGIEMAMFSVKTNEVMATTIPIIAPMM